MLIEFKCPCGFVFRTQAANAGKKIKCPECMRQQVVPTPAGEKPTAKPAATAPGKPAKKPAAKPIAKSDDDDEIEEIPFLDEEDDDETFDEALPLPSKKPKRSGLQELPSVVRHSSSGRKKEIHPPGYKKERDDKANKGPGWGMVLGLIGVAVLFVGGGGLALALAMRGEGRQKETGPLQVKLIPVRHDTSALSWTIPDGWSYKTGGGTGGLPASMSCEDADNDVRIVLRMTPAGSVIGEAGRAVDNMDGKAEEDPRLQPAAQIHELMKVVAKENYPDYEEIGDPQVFNSGLGDSRVSQFTGSGDWGSKVAGYRMTILSIPDSYTVYFTCPANKWKSYEPVFRDVMKSINR